MLHGGFLLFNSPDIGHTGPPMQKPCKLVEQFGGAHRVDLYPAVVLIPDPSAKAEATRTILHEPAEPHTLYTSGNEPAAGVVLHLKVLHLERGRPAQRGVSDGRAEANSA